MIGAGAVGVAGLVGGAVVTAQEDDENGVDQEDEQAALRVAHASPDAPAVDVRVNGNGDDGDDPLIEGLEFREVSNYAEIAAGTYQVQVVVPEDDDEEMVVFDEEVEVSEGTAYTAVAYGVVAQGLPTDSEGSEGGNGGNETDTNETNETDTNESAENGANETDNGATPGQMGDSERGFQVEILEDDLSAPDETTARVRVFHAVPDVDAVSISAVPGEEEDLEEDEQDTNETDNGGTATEDEETLVEELDYGDSDTFELEEGDQVLIVREDGNGGTTGGGNGDTGDNGATEEDGVQLVEVSPSGGVVYSGFALGYFDPEAVEEEDDEGEEFELVFVVDSQDGERDEGGT